MFLPLHNATVSPSMRNCLIIKELLKAGITALIKFQRDLSLRFSEDFRRNEERRSFKEEENTYRDYL
jgi:hypothetical protein